jgi:transposase InsO family protein
LQQDVKLELIKELNSSEDYQVLQMCELFIVPRSTYYDWLKRDYSKDDNIKDLIKTIFIESRETYGIKRIHAELLSRGIKIGHNKVAKLKQELNLYPKMRRKHKQTTDSNNNNKVCENLLNREFNSNIIREKVVSDITYISTLEGWIYLATLIDLSTRKVISYEISETMEAEMITKILTEGFKGKEIPKGAIFHSDRGSQYTSNEVKKLLLELGIKQSMSRKGNCWDNAVAESFFKTLKYDGDIKKVFKTKQEAKLTIFEFIEVFYNKKRRHSALGYLTPQEAENYLLNINFVI